MCFFGGELPWSDDRTSAMFCYVLPLRSATFQVPPQHLAPKAHLFGAAFALFAETFVMHFERYLRYVCSFWPLCRDLRNSF